MFRILADENLNQAIVRGLLRRDPSIDIVRVQDVGLSGADDPTILEWATRERRVLLTHDSSTVTRYAYERMRRGQPMAGVLQVPLRLSPGDVIEDVLMFLECTTEQEWTGRVRYLPL